MPHFTSSSRKAFPYTAAILFTLTSLLAPRSSLAQTPAVTYTDLHDFNPGAGDVSNFQATKPAQGRDGNFYAESRGGGTSGLGTVFNVSRGGTVKAILSFNGHQWVDRIGRHDTRSGWQSVRQYVRGWNLGRRRDVQSDAHGDLHRAAQLHQHRRRP